VGEEVGLGEGEEGREEVGQPRGENFGMTAFSGVVLLFSAVVLALPAVDLNNEQPPCSEVEATRPRAGGGAPHCQRGGRPGDRTGVIGEDDSLATPGDIRISHEHFLFESFEPFRSLSTAILDDKSMLKTRPWRSP
jgi:hypothetical protein